MKINFPWGRPWHAIWPQNTPSPSKIGHDLAMVNVQKRRDEQAEMRDKIHQNCREMCIKHGMPIPERLRSK